MRLLSTASSSKRTPRPKYTAKEETMSRTKTRTRRPSVIPDTYFKLVRQHPLTSIRDDAELDAAQSILDDLLRRELDEGEQAYLEALSDLVVVYENEQHAIEPLPPHELLGYMLVERGMSQADLVRATGIAKATVSDLVSGKR